MHILTSVKDVERRMEELDEEITSIETQIVTNIESIKRIKHTIEAGATRIRLKEEECCKLTARAKALSKKWYALNEVVVNKLKEKPQLRCQA